MFWSRLMAKLSRRSSLQTGFFASILNDPVFTICFFGTTAWKPIVMAMIATINNTRNLNILIEFVVKLWS